MLRYWRIFLIVIVFLSLSLTSYLLFSPTPSKPNVLSTILQKERVVDVTAHVGKYKIEKLTGWSSPFSEITLSSRYTFRKTSADETGFFVFYSIPIDETRGLCLIAQDVNMFPSFPLCLAPLVENQDIIIENVLLSPTISLESNQIPSGKTAKASGMTFPGSQVDVYFFIDNNFTIWTRITDFFLRINLFKTAEAMGLPQYKINSNKNGYFEFSLPSSSPSESRVFVASHFQADIKSAPTTDLWKSAGNLRESESYSSPKSNTLSFQTLNPWIYLKLIFGFFCQWVLSFKIGCCWLFILIMIETLILILLFGLFLHKKKRLKRKDIGPMCPPDRKPNNGIK